MRDWYGYAPIALKNGKTGTYIMPTTKLGTDPFANLALSRINTHGIST